MIPSHTRSRTRSPGWSALPQPRTARPDSPRGELLVALIALVLAGGGLEARPAFAAAQVRPQWTWRNPIPTGNDLLGVAMGNGTMVAVGSGGTLLSSTDGHEWTQQWDGRSTPLTDILFVNGQFVAVGGDGVILISTDGTNWLSRAVTPTFNFRQVAYGLGRYVVAAESQGRCAFLSSTQLESWTTWWLPERQPLTRVTFGDGRFVGIGSSTSGADGTGVFVSTNGVSWMDRSTSAVLGGMGVAAAQGAVIVGDRFGNLWRSFNVSDWELAGGIAAGRFRNLMIVNGQFVATVDSSPPGLLSSPDGVNWSAWESGGIMPLNAVAGDGTHYLAVGDFGQIVGSPDGQTWTNRTGYLAPEFARASWFEAVTFGNGRFVAVGCAAAAVSTDGEHWIATGLAPNTWLVGVVFDGHRFVAVGKQGAVAWSTDGMTWEGGDPVGSDDFAGVAFGGGVYMAAVARRTVAGSVAGSALLASTNLTAWREVYLRDGVGAARVAFGNNRFVATLNGSDDVCVSTNGTDWETRTLTQGTPVDMIYADERFHAVNGSSPDGFAWSFAAGPPVVDDPTWEYRELGGLAAGDGRFAALGSHGFPLPGSVAFVSTNGTTWQPTAPAPIGLRATAYGNGSFVAVGGNLGILQSPAAVPAPPIQLAAARLGPVQLQIRVTSPIGKTLVIERSSDLKSWSGWRTIVNTTGQSLLTDALAPPPGRSFYRARVL